jgi:leucyl-tRNA synthetase
VLLLAPYAPHLAEELWQRLGHTSSLTYASWPVADESLLVVDTVKLPVQVGYAQNMCSVCLGFSPCLV